MGGENHGKGRKVLMQIKISDIHIGPRFRNDCGDLQALADSIEEQGLLQPIGITPENRLVFGERRIIACRDFLGWEDIDCRVVDVTSIIEGEHAENEMRKAFTVSERESIGRAIEAEIGNRQGQRTDKLPENFPEVQGKETRQIAAEKAGFGNETTFRQAKKVVSDGIPKLIEQVDAGEIAVSRAAQIAKLPPEEQEEVISKPHVSHNAGNNEWYTPPEFIAAARKVLSRIDIDPASSEVANRVVGATTFYTKEENGLSYPWIGNVWMNPPYASPLISAFASKLCEEYDNENIEGAIVLVNNATETKWFQQMAIRAASICFPEKRIRFLDEEGNPGAPLQGQGILYFGDYPQSFRDEFAEFGFVVGACHASF